MCVSNIKDSWEWNHFKNVIENSLEKEIQNGKDHQNIPQLTKLRYMFYIHSGCGQIFAAFRTVLKTGENNSRFPLDF